MSANTLPPADSRQRAKQLVQDLQDKICQGLEQLDGAASFQEDQWERAAGGGGRTRVIRDGRVFEQGGVNFSEVWGDSLPAAILSQRPEAAGHSFYATGTSMVLHPRNPYVPTVHLNYRYFEAGPVWWFGGGADLTPYYPFAEDAVHFHKTHKAACDAHHPVYYPAFKRWCDEYFYLKHRQEQRGIGGLFFDYLDYRGNLYSGPNHEGEAARYSREVGPLSHSWEALFALVKSCGDAFLPAYLPIADRRQDMEYGDRQRQFQLYRRGRYVEFNLIYDRGTIFGLQTNGRAESILMSLPPVTRWQYNYHPEANTPEAALYEIFLKPQDWVNWPLSEPTTDQPEGGLAEARAKAKQLRFKYHQTLDQLYHQLLDEVVAANLPDGEMAKLAQTLLLSKQEGLQHLVSIEEQAEYQALFGDA